MWRPLQTVGGVLSFPKEYIDLIISATNYEHFLWNNCLNSRSDLATTMQDNPAKACITNFKIDVEIIKRLAAFTFKIYVREFHFT